MSNMIWNIALFIITFSLLVTVHECGHFFMAKIFGVKVICFSIGFGKSIIRFNIYDTEFVISIFPFGGYVKMLDERSDEVPLHLLHKTFNRKPIWKRVLIILSGPVANLIMAIFMYFIVFFQSTVTLSPIIGKVIKESPIEKLQITAGMEIKKIDDINTPDWDTVRMALISKNKKSSVTLTFSNINENIIYTKKLNLNKLNFDQQVKDPLDIVGIVPLLPIIKFLVTKSNDINITNEHNLQVGDIITKLDGNKLVNAKPFINYIKDYQKKDIQIEVNRKNKILQFKLNVDKIIESSNTNNLSIVPQIIFPENYKIIHRYNLFSSFKHSIIKTSQLIKLIISSICNLVNGNFNVDNLSGPITIAHGASISAKRGIAHYLSFLSLISINLFVFNLLPLPILDGGHLLFLIIEKIIQKPLSNQIQNIFSWIGFSILIIFITIALSNDISHFISNYNSL
ncbi:RIP metalloprotease RseP [Pantoea sp. SoEX]|uniref:RIP metalloprotease RseP n=1 Tax=Pantoea sp. SoEX TaxID=2576763 RepID=UPI00135ADA00|nr:RIP metalloprotease RseP [Pantoea sp. SoEX]MXP51178.1 RIP metalloprotease RseP [Pantoea sp. SoEX]